MTRRVNNEREIESQKCLIEWYFLLSVLSF